MENVIITSLNYHEETKSFYLTVKDTMSSNPFLRTKSTKTGTIWLSTKGSESLRTELAKELTDFYGTDKLNGTVMKDVSWGQAVTGIDGVFELNY